MLAMRGLNSFGRRGGLLLGVLLFGLQSTPGIEAAEPGATFSRSIREWTVCDGKQDDRSGVAKAFAEAKNHAFTLIVDCPVYIHVGSDISRPIFVEDGTTVQFGTHGRFVTDNVLIPTWVIANSSDIELLNWRVEYVGQLPIDPDTKGYVINGTFVPSRGKYQPAGAFHDFVLTPWLAANRGIVFDRSDGPITSPWPGPTATSAIFYVLGSSSSIKIRGMKMFVPKSADGSRFIPVCFLTTVGYKNGQRVSAALPVDADSATMPSDIEVADLELDGTYMGWLGNLRNSHFNNIRSFRYGDLQDSLGGSVGGLGKWFAPPHLFYITTPKFKDLRNTKLEIRNVHDWGLRSGVARDQDKASLSGNALSLKISAADSRVENYISYRPDGLLDLLPSERLVMVGLMGSYDSSFLHGIYPAVRFPVGPYHDVTFEDVEIEDRARGPTIGPIGDILDANSTNVSLRKVRAVLHAPAPNAQRQPRFLGKDHSAMINILSD
ncbi:hypothetical protein I6F36_28105 [Bradyrhizobium sp. BRP19]|uniref:hypothetical protein n=1 Tax=Bradyrhizobium sp. BRP19 TaxID=2793823 RepID=UPI001CD321F3|nr:hypothetical protein [Bradyrhizobium sp. BRP19]MCA1550699.1 hypothetical protein [Bradyrhizobium sp. BRP19]